MTFVYCINTMNMSKKLNTELSALIIEIYLAHFGVHKNLQKYSS